MIRTRVTRISQVITVVVGVALASLAWTASASAASAPSVESESVSNITATDATMEARLDPGGLETEYQFRVIGAPCRAEPVNCLIPPGSGPDYPSPPARIAAASGGQVVKLDLTSAGLTLTPGKEYHYAVFATNPQGTASGPEQSFTTPPTNAPLIEGESVSHITATDATLEAQINPNGLETTYRFELESGCGIEKPEPGHATCMVIVGTSVPPGQIPPSSEGETVRVNLEAAGVTLRPDTEYRYRVAATNSAGSTKQEEAQVFKQTFTTSSSAPVIESESVSSITPTDATLEAKINTEGLETTYEFNLSERWRCEEVEPRCLRPGLQTFFGLPADKLLGSFVGQTVSLDLNSAGVILSPGHNFYEYSIRATSAAGTTGGEPKRFTTPSEAGTEPLTEPSGSTDPQSSATIQSLPSGPRPRLVRSPTKSRVPHSRRSQSCGPAKGTTLLVERKARIYSLGESNSQEPQRPERIYGCLVSTGHSIKLSPLPKTSRWGAPWMYRPFALDAPWAAGAVSQQTGRDSHRLSVTARNLHSGQRKSCFVGSGDHSPRSRGSVTSIALKRNGSLAWAGHARIGEVVAGQFPPARSSPVTPRGSASSIVVPGSTSARSRYMA